MSHRNANCDPQDAVLESSPTVKLYTDDLRIQSVRPFFGFVGLALTHLTCQLLATEPVRPTVLSEIRIQRVAPTGTDSSIAASEMLKTSHAAVLLVTKWTAEAEIAIAALDDFSAYYGILGFTSLSIFSPSDATHNTQWLARKNRDLELRHPIAPALALPQEILSRTDQRNTTLLLLVASGRVASIEPLPTTERDIRTELRTRIESHIPSLPIEPTKYLELVKNNLPADPEQLRRFVLMQSLELHRVHRQMPAATQGIDKYPKRNRGTMMRSMNRKTSTMKSKKELP